MTKIPQRTEPPRGSDRSSGSRTLTRPRPGRPAPEYDQPTGASVPEDEFDQEIVDEFDEFDEFDDEPDDAPAR